MERDTLLESILVQKYIGKFTHCDWHGVHVWKTSVSRDYTWSKERIFIWMGGCPRKTRLRVKQVLLFLWRIWSSKDSVSQYDIMASYYSRN